MDWGGIPRRDGRPRREFSGLARQPGPSPDGFGAGWWRGHLGRDRPGCGRAVQKRTGAINAARYIAKQWTVAVRGIFHCREDIAWADGRKSVGYGRARVRRRRSQGRNRAREARGAKACAAAISPSTISPLPSSPYPRIAPNPMARSPGRPRPSSSSTPRRAAKGAWDIPMPTPVPGDHGAHGIFDVRARTRSRQLWATTHSSWLAVGGAGLAALAAHAGVRV